MLLFTNPPFKPVCVSPVNTKQDILKNAGQKKRHLLTSIIGTMKSLDVFSYIVQFGLLCLREEINANMCTYRLNKLFFTFGRTVQ